jgi:hypothetical protein
MDGVPCVFHLVIEKTEVHNSDMSSAAIYNYSDVLVCRGWFFVFRYIYMVDLSIQAMGTAI